MTRTVGVLLAGILGGSAACADHSAQPPPRVATAPAPPTTLAAAPAVPPPAAPDPRADLAAKIDPIFAAYSSGRTPGCAVGVYRAGDVVYSNGYGYSDLEHDSKNGDTTPFYLASVSKQFTAAAVLLLVQDGKVSLDDDVRKYVPELPDYGKPITLAHLLHHTSGVRDYGLPLVLQGSEDSDHVTNDDVLWILAHQRSLNFPTGTKYLYSNSGYVLLSLVVARVTGKPFSAFVKERIFDPLGMTDSLVKDDSTRIIPRRAVGYAPNPDKTYGIALSNSEYTGPGNVMSTIRDLAKWDANFYAPKVGGQALVDSMRVRGKLANGTEISYAMGLVEDKTHGLARETHDGAFVGYVTEIDRYPTERLTVTVLCNDASAAPDVLAEKVATVFLPQLGQPEAGPAEGKAAAESPKSTAALGVDPSVLAGTYLNEETFELRVIDAKDGAIHLRFARGPDGPQRELVAVGPRELLVKDGTTRYAFEPAKGKVAARIVRKAVDGPGETYVRIEPIDALPAEKLAEYAGRYASDEIARDVDFAVKGGKLVPGSWGRGLAPMALAPLARDIFVVGEIRFRFERGAGGKVSGVIVSSGRALGVKLQKRAK